MKTVNSVIPVMDAMENFKSDEDCAYDTCEQVVTDILIFILIAAAAFCIVLAFTQGIAILFLFSIAFSLLASFVTFSAIKKFMWLKTVVKKIASLISFEM